SVHAYSREEKVAEVLLSVPGVRAVPILGPELRQPRWSDVLRAPAEIVLDRDVVPADVEHGGGVDSVNDVARDIQRVHLAAVQIRVDDRVIGRVILIGQIGPEAAEAAEHLPLVVDDVVGAAADVVIEILAEVIGTEVIHTGRVIAGAVSGPDLSDELRRRRID